MRPAASSSARRNPAPEVEHSFMRSSQAGPAPSGQRGFLHCLQHGSPSPLERWHCHDEYELHLIADTRGWAFIGDHVGRFEPGHLVLTGPRLPHNWVSHNLPCEGVALRSQALQFADAPLRKGMEVFKELQEAAPLLEKARHGVEFFGISDSVREHFDRMQCTEGPERFAEFLRLLSRLVRCKNQRVLSSGWLPIKGHAEHVETIGKAVAYIRLHLDQPLSAPSVCEHAGISLSSFSRQFSQATDVAFTDFVNQLRVGKACQLLMETDQQISSICYAAGFNNIANFNRRFLKIKGMTPKAFRLQTAMRHSQGQTLPISRFDMEGTGVGTVAAAGALRANAGMYRQS
ncbi:helix-turn-helix domain-containing protein [Variovorax sp. Root473]|uniref:helix-turn-helix domain-containing protein n=1 Tax=Variovorax sp. Root473 TaxID=1736541 RepID=UPI0009E91186|nr:AraC family transcriptional regulator [Variovorax sp. Root473]